MATIQEYLEKMSDDELRGVLRSYCLGVMDITVDSAFLICKILASCDSQLPNPRSLFLGLCRTFC